jgi:hypothetical protein
MKFRGSYGSPCIFLGQWSVEVYEWLDKRLGWEGNEYAYNVGDDRVQKRAVERLTADGTVT